MNNEINAPKLIHLRDDQIRHFYSDYLINGRRQESWLIEYVEIEDLTLKSSIRMSDIYLSGTDENKFHLTIFSALEFLSQLMIIYGHVWAGLSSKSQEGWMVDSEIRALKAIRNPHAIQVEMKMSKTRKRGKTLMCMSEYVLTDDGGGRFEGRLTGFLS